MDGHSRATIAFYCTTALPLIVAITNIATGAGAMSADIASLLVAAGGLTVFLMPLLASFALKHIKGPTQDEPGESPAPRKDDI